MKYLRKVFLGGTCNNSTWRDELMPQLTIDYFNPVVDDWTEDDQLKEEYEKDQCDIHYYCITKDMTGVYSIAEMIDSVHNRNKKTVVHVIPDGFKDNQIKSFKAVLNLINQRGGITFLSNDLNLSVELLNALQYM